MHGCVCVSVAQIHRLVIVLDMHEAMSYALFMFYCFGFG